MTEPSQPTKVYFSVLVRLGESKHAMNLGAEFIGSIDRAALDKPKLAEDMIMNLAYEAVKLAIEKYNSPRLIANA